MSGTPLPAKLMLLEDLPRCSPLDKVRFLGYVHTYDTTNAILILKHEPSSITDAYVDVTPILNTIKRDLTEVGAWINVIGYLEQDAKRDHVRIQAVTIWDAGDVNIVNYMKAVRERHAADTRYQDLKV